MNKRMKIVIGVIIFVILFVLFSKMISKSDKTVCQDFRIEILNVTEETYITSEELMSKVISEYHELKGVPMSEISLDKVKEIISSSPFVKRVKVYKSLDASIIAEVEQRDPLVRVFNKVGKAFVIDENGDIMPVPVGKSSHIICASGNINTEPDSLWGRNVQTLMPSENGLTMMLNSIFIIARALQSDVHFSALISQIYLNEMFELELIPAIGDFSILFGQAVEITEKLEKLYILYTKMLPYMDMSAYKEVDLTLKNQIVLKK